MDRTFNGNGNLGCRELLDYTVNLSVSGLMMSKPSCISASFTSIELTRLRFVPSPLG